MGQLKKESIRIMRGQMFFLIDTLEGSSQSDLNFVLKQFQYYLTGLKNIPIKAISNAASAIYSIPKEEIIFRTNCESQFLNSTDLEKGHLFIPLSIISYKLYGNAINYMPIIINALTAHFCFNNRTLLRNFTTNVT